jgi:hypothetical protein
VEKKNVLTLAAISHLQENSSVSLLFEHDILWVTAMLFSTLLQSIYGVSYALHFVASLAWAFLCFTILHWYFLTPFRYPQYTMAARSITSLKRLSETTLCGCNRLCFDLKKSTVAIWWWCTDQRSISAKLKASLCMVTVRREAPCSKHAVFSNFKNREVFLVHTIHTYWRTIYLSKLQQCH